MMWRSALILILTVLCLAPAAVEVRAQEPDIDAILAAMSLEQRVAQMFMVSLYGPQLTYAGRDLLAAWQPGAAVIMTSNAGTPDQVARLTHSYQQTVIDAGGVPLLIATDQEGGLIQQLEDGFTTWPAPMLLTAADDPDLAFRFGAALGRELRAVGINMNLAPVADLNTYIDNPVIGRRAHGSRPDQVGRTIAAVIEGMQSEGVLATAKHFPGHGDTRQDSHITLPVIDHDLARLQSVELPPFVSAIEAESGAIMVAHIWYRAIEPQENLPASLSYNVVTGLLREDLGYEGIIATDALDMDAIDTVYSPEQAAVMAVEAGNDLIVIGAHVGEAAQIRAMQAVVDAVRAGQIDSARIDASVRRILAAKARFGLLDGPPIDPDAVTLDRAGNDALIEAMFRAGVTVARDDFDHVPLRPESSVGIIFPGNRAQVQRECGAYRDDVRWLAISDSPADGEIASASALADQVDVAIVFTRDAYHNAAQQALIHALPPDRVVVVALISPYDLLRFPAVGGYIATYSPLDPAVTVACAILFGAQGASGVLPFDLVD
jgi:beta-N-acetylhexosaminidase